MPIWSPEFETMPRDQLERLQAQRLRELVARVGVAVPFYKRKLADTKVRSCAKVSADDIKSLDDLKRLPFTEKRGLRDNYPFGMFSVPVEEVVRIHASSGTTGKPTVGGYTRADLDLWAEVMARTLACAGVTRADVIHNAYGYGLFTGGLGVHIGAEKIGAAVVPISGGLTKRQVMLIEDFGATVLTCTPSYPKGRSCALVIAEEAAEQGIDIKQRFKLRVGIFGAEPWSERMRHEIEAKLNLHALNLYGLTEVTGTHFSVGPGVAQECEP